MLEVCDRICVMYSGEVIEEGTIDSIFTWPKHPYTHGLFGCIPLPYADKNARPLVAIPGQLPLPHERPPGCNFGPRCTFFQGGQCDASDIAIEPVTTDDDPAHRVRCRRWNDIDHQEAIAVGVAHDPIEIGEKVLKVDSMQKYYEVFDRSLKALISGRRVKHVKANEALDFTARRGQTIGIVGESWCGKSTFAKVLMGLETATDGEIRLNGQNIADVSVQDRTAPPARFPADGVPESRRHPQSQPHHRRPDRARDPQVRRREGPPGAPAGDGTARPGQAAPGLLPTAGRASSRAARSSGSASPAPSPGTRPW